MKVFVASACRWVILHMTHVLEAQGHEVLGRWLEAPYETFEGGELAGTIAKETVEDINQAGAVVIVTGAGLVLSAELFAAGYALATGKKVVVLGCKDIPAILRHPDVSVAKYPAEVEKFLGQDPSHGGRGVVLIDDMLAEDEYPVREE